MVCLGTSMFGNILVCDQVHNDPLQQKPAVNYGNPFLRFALLENYDIMSSRTVCYQ